MCLQALYMYERFIHVQYELKVHLCLDIVHAYHMMYLKLRFCCVQCMHFSLTMIKYTALSF